MPEELRKCIFCNNDFVISKYRPSQRVCLDEQCQRQRQLLNIKEWREKYPDYFKYQERKTLGDVQRAQYLKLWRQAHKDYYRVYRAKLTQMSVDQANPKYEILNSK